mgnify:CR=1 FL=1
MRLGAQPCQLKKGTLARQAYRESKVQERHRHRYEFNSNYREPFAKVGMIISGYLPGKRLAEIVELTNHPFFLGCQFHPELRSKPDRCHPLFRAFVKHALQHSQEPSVKDPDAVAASPEPVTVAAS